MDTELHINADGNVYLGTEGSYGQIKANSAAILTNMFKIDAPRMGILPPAVRWYSHSGRAFLVERPPQVMSLQYYPAAAINVKSDLEKQILLIPLPWTVHLIEFKDHKLKDLSRIFLYGRNTPIQSMDDALYRLPLPNSMDHGQVCIGDRAFKDYHKLLQEIKDNCMPLTVAACINAALTVMWQAGFNDDVAIGAHAIPAPLLEKSDGKSNFKAVTKAWETFSLEEILKWEWKSCDGYSPKQISVRDACKFVETIHKENFRTVAEFMKVNMGYGV
jgi:hypothetical protein